MIYDLYILLIFVFGCEQNEIPIQPSMGELQSYQIEMESDYKYQVFYNLENNIVVKQNIKTEWDLAFESSQDGWKIITNSARFAQVSELVNSNFEDIIAIDNLTWRWEDPKGIIEETAIGDYRQKNAIYIIDRGFQIDGTNTGYKKITIDSINQNMYSIKYANLDNTESRNIQIIKNDNYNFQYLSFEDDNLKEIEPKKEDWDLIFTQYTELYNDPELPPSYLVTGVLSNYLNNVLIAKDTVNNFEEIDNSMINLYAFQNKQDPPQSNSVTSMRRERYKHAHLLFQAEGIDAVRAATRACRSVADCCKTSRRWACHSIDRSSRSSSCHVSGNCYNTFFSSFRFTVLLRL